MTASVSERSSLLHAVVDRIEEDDEQEAPRRVSTAADADGVRQSFTVHTAVSNSKRKSFSVRERLHSWIEDNAFLLLMMAISAGALLVIQVKGRKIFGLSYPITASPLLFGIVKFALDIIEPILFGIVLWMSSFISFHILVVIQSFRDHIHRIVLSATLYAWFWYYGRDPLLSNILEACTLSMGFWMLKDISMRFARRFIIVTSMMKSIRQCDLEREALIMLCCPTEDIRANERNRSPTDYFRLSLSSKLEVIRKGALDLPLGPVGDSDVHHWKYSNESLVRITSLHQMRLIAAVLRDNLFEGGRRPTVTYDYWCSLFSDHKVADKTWLSLFQQDKTMVMDKITGKDFVWGIYQSFERRMRMASQLLNLTNLFTLVGSAFTGAYMIVVVAIFAACLGADLSRLTVTISTSFVALSFALSGTITRIFEAIVFIFVTKPFEIGDRVTIEGEDFFVHKIRLMSTVLRKLDQRVMQISNSALSKQPIYNHRRSGPAMLDLRFMVGYETTAAKLQQLKQVLRKYVEENSDIWRGDIEFLVENLDGDLTVNMIVRCHHRLTWQEKATLDEHRFDLAQCLRNAMNDLKIYTSDSNSIVIKQELDVAPTA